MTHRTLILRVLQFLQPARDLRWDRLVILVCRLSVSMGPSCSLVDGDVLLEQFSDDGDSCCMFGDSAWNE
jgi:hypothetical protein